MSNITHNTRLATSGVGSIAHPVQAYAIRLNSVDAEVRLDLNPTGTLTVVDLTPGDTRKLIAILRAALADVEESVA